MTSRSAPGAPYRPPFPASPPRPATATAAAPVRAPAPVALLGQAPRTPVVQPAPAAPGALRGRHVLVVGPDGAPHPLDAAPGTAVIAEHLATTADAVTRLAAVPHASRPGRARAALRDLTFLVGATAAGRGLAPDLVIGAARRPAGRAAAAWLAGRRGAPLITLVQTPPATPAPRRTPHVGAALDRYALRRSSQVAIASETFRDGVLAAGVDPGRLHLLPPWSRVRAAALSPASARRELGWDPDGVVAVHAGPLGHGQDGATLVTAARILAAVDGPAIVLAGDGSQRAGLARLALGVPGLRLLDAVDDVTLPLVLAAADVLLVAETSGGGTAAASRRLADYLAAGRPVVAVTPAGGPTAAGLHRTSGAGVRVAPGDAVALARVLQDLAAAPERRATMGRAAGRYARAHLGRDASLRRLAAIVEAALEPSPPTASPPTPSPPTPSPSLPSPSLPSSLSPSSGSC